MKCWSCSQIDQFEIIEYIYLSECYLFKGVQTGVFVVLIFYLIHKIKMESVEIGWITVLMAFLAALNGIFSIIRVQAVFPIFNDNINNQTFMIAYCIEYIGQFGALWFFAIKYFEAARDLQLMLSDSENSSIRASTHTLTKRLKQRKASYLYLRWLVFALLVICMMAVTIVMCITSIGALEYQIIIATTYGLLMLLIVVVGALMVWALRIFVRVVSHLSQRFNLNHCFVWLQVSCIFLLALVWMSQGIFLGEHFKDFDDYGPIR